MPWPLAANFASRTLLDVYAHFAGEEIVPEIGVNSCLG